MNAAVKALRSSFHNVTTVTALLLAFLAINVLGQTNDGPRILFLHLQLKNESVSLIKSSVQPGHLKPRPNPDDTDGIHFELTDSDGFRLWTGAMADPRSRRVEHEDPPGSGKLKSKKVELRDPEFTVRVPLLSEARQIEFYTLVPIGSEDKLQRRSLGKLPLPAP